MIANKAVMPAKGFSFGFIGWKSYNRIKKKAVEQEFPGGNGGLILSLSIAFFIVLSSAYIFSLVNQSIMSNCPPEDFMGQKVYHLENSQYLNVGVDSNFYIRRGPDFNRRA